MWERSHRVHWVNSCQLAIGYDRITATSRDPNLVVMYLLRRRLRAFVTTDVDPRGPRPPGAMPLGAAGDGPTQRWMPRGGVIQGPKTLQSAALLHVFRPIAPPRLTRQRNALSPATFTRTHGRPVCLPPC